MSPDNMSEKLWDLANLITGFAVLQTLAMLFAVIKGDIPVLMQATVRRLAFVGTIVFTLLYMGAITWCGIEGYSLNAPHDYSVWLIVTLGRIVVVLIFSYLMSIALMGTPTRP
jgi:hypothetical protein